MDALAITLLMIEESQTRFSGMLSVGEAATVFSCLSDDPANWDEVATVWRRYRTGDLPEFADSLVIVATSRIEQSVEDAVAMLPDNGFWIAIDFTTRRVLTGTSLGDAIASGASPLGEALDYGDEVEPEACLPPWWEFTAGTNRDAILLDRQQPLEITVPPRDVLWGKTLSEGLSYSMLSAFRSDAWRQANADESRRARYAFTVEVHRDWLMTPRADLAGKFPRQFLHGGHAWLENVIHAQRWFLVEYGQTFPIASDFSSYATAPVGRNEVCMYFDACREMIEFGWDWLVSHASESDSPKFSEQLAVALEERKREWMRAPGEMGVAPMEVIEAERKRIPEVASEGFGESDDGHGANCDCPLCEMLGEGELGPVFIGYDGYRLELDDEYAFSLCETRDEWERDRDLAGDDMGGEAEGSYGGSDEDQDEELGSPWRQTFISNDLIGDDPNGHVTIAFLLTEIVDTLKRSDAPKHEVDAVNQAFRDYRQAAPEEIAAVTRRFVATLEKVATQHPSLISRSADLQSRLHELLRQVH